MPSENGLLQALALRHEQPAKRDLAALFVKQFPHRIGDGSIMSEALTRGESVLSTNISQEYISNRDARYAAILRALEVHSEIAVPVLVDGAPVCAILVVRSENRQPFNEQDRRFLETFAARTALAYANAKAQERERTIAATLQRALLPGALPAVGGVRFSASYSPAAQENLVGGDWYDAFAIDGRRVIVSIGDVVGHGLQAATIMASLRQAVRGFALENRDPAAILSSLNRFTMAENPGSLATAYVATIDAQTLEMRVASAGHHPALLLGTEGAIKRVTAHGLILGVDENAAYESTTSKLEAGELLALFTDGFVENERDFARGEQRFIEVLAAARHASAPATAVHLGLFGSTPPRDDAALITVLAEPTLPDVNLELEASPESAGFARTALRRFLQAVPLPDERQFEVLVAAGEAIVNAIEHAYAGGRGTVRVRAAVEGANVAVEIEDDGGIWDVEGIDRAQRGYGIPLMHALSDSVEIARNATGTRVRIIAALGAVPA
jgi:serine phosphatase RsbU (regulator of sigma subunit)/anti-sigma regulatory factor (Ser/Thr protein kinase)